MQLVIYILLLVAPS